VNPQNARNLRNSRYHNIASSTANGYAQGPHNAIRAIYEYGILTLKE
jgi:hypothetical protein